MIMHHRIPFPALAGLLATLLLGACASQVPQNIREAPADNPPLAQVREQAADYQGRQVRWGGRIIETVNEENTTRLTLLERPTNKDGEPRYTDDSAGRFIAIVPEFLDPKVYAPDRRVSVTGTLTRTEAGKVGEYPYNYPVVEAEAWYLWPPEPAFPYDYDDPWYDPWWYDRWYYQPWYYHGIPYAYPYRYWR